MKQITLEPGEELLVKVTKTKWKLTNTEIDILKKLSDGWDAQVGGSLWTHLSKGDKAATIKSGELEPLYEHGLIEGGDLTGVHITGRGESYLLGILEDTVLILDKAEPFGEAWKNPKDEAYNAPTKQTKRQKQAKVKPTESLYIHVPSGEARDTSYVVRVGEKQATGKTLRATLMEALEGQTPEFTAQEKELVAAVLNNG